MSNVSINLTYLCNRGCDYCHAKDFSKRWSNEISLKGLEFVFKWLSNQKKKTRFISFVGGEPTLFSQINTALGLAKKYNFQVVFYTNGIFDIKKINIYSPAISLFAVNLNSRQEYSNQDLELLYFNLKKLRKASRRVGLRFNITSTNSSYEHLITACKKLGIDNVGFSLAIPSIFGRNKHVKRENLKSFSSYLLKLTKDLLKNKIKFSSYCPVPYCSFSKKERDFLIKNNGIRGTCDIERDYTITPDLTVLPCSPLAIEGPSLKSFKNEEEIFDYYKEFIDKLKWEVDLFPECKNCDFRKKKQCQGSCLIYKILKVNNSLQLMNKKLRISDIMKKL